jgi:hypothetical protein
MADPKVAPAGSVRHASVADVQAMARTLARAFYDDAFWKWFMPDDATRAQRLERMFVTFTRNVYLRHGNDCYTTDTYDGAALWAPPGTRAHVGRRCPENPARLDEGDRVA